MPKSSSERNKEYRRRLRAKAKAWDHVEQALVNIGRQFPKGCTTMNDAAVALDTAYLALVKGCAIVEQANG